MLGVVMSIFVLILVLSAILFPSLDKENLITIYTSNLLSDLSTVTMAFFMILPITDFILTVNLLMFNDLFDYFRL